MNLDSKNERNVVSLDEVKQQLRALAVVEPSNDLKERLLAAVPCRAQRGASRWQVRQWPRATGWAGIAAAILVLCSILWLRTLSGPSVSPSPDANSSLSRVLAADHNSVVHPADINALDSNGLY